MEALTVAAAGASVTKVIDFIRTFLGRNWSEAEKDAKEKRLKWVWPALALAIGVGVAFLFDVAPVELPGVDVGEIGIKIATGLAIGGVSSGWHEFFDFLSGAAKRAHETALATRKGTLPRA